jgi:hypothetical protein
MRVGVAWYSEAEWMKLRQVAPDPEGLEPTYPEWVAMFEDGLRKLAEAGVAAERVEITVGALQTWCAQHGRALDSSARSALAAELLRQRYEPRAR